MVVALGLFALLHPDFAGFDPLLQGLPALEDLLAVATWQHGDDGFLFNNCVEDFAEVFEGHEHLRLGEHHIECANRLALVLGATDGLIELIPHIFIIVFAETGNQLAQPLDGAVRDAVTAVAGE